jgi:hypothetical protein
MLAFFQFSQNICGSPLSSKGPSDSFWQCNVGCRYLPLYSGFNWFYGFFFICHAYPLFGGNMNVGYSIS